MELPAKSAQPAPPHVSPRGTWTTKLALRILQFALALSIIGCAASSAFWSANALVFITPQAAFSVVWTIADGIAIVVRGGHRGIHPGANVGVDLLLWLGFLVGTVLLWIVSSHRREAYQAVEWGGVEVIGEMGNRVAIGQALVGLALTLM
ncbi:hypothetical protein C7999DRAFT_42231 [Corynascus novoguineensis]|uniref:MARVEL domain-containing protein n=1 Tax=Corynascus novoguineensis TaxID=1126955 RepID=A0AAN7CT04_9PEZI|nr:hypothetical protein C7999DRAFT_42231 [Corynascus novoguineensis]